MSSLTRATLLMILAVIALILAVAGVALMVYGIFADKTIYILHAVLFMAQSSILREYVRMKLKGRGMS